MIALDDVALEAGGRRLLDGITGSIRSGEFVAIAGPNGVGKTTLLRTISALHSRSRGMIKVAGDDVARLTPSQRAHRIAYVMSDEVMTDALLVRDVVATGRYPHHRWWQWTSTSNDDAIVSNALRAVGMDRFEDRLLNTLSTGERQRVWIAMGLAQEAPVMLLDEPTSHLDVRVAHTILSLLRSVAQSGKSVVCVMHDLNDAAMYADRIALLGCGKLLAFDTPDAVLASNSIEDAYGISMERVRLSGGRLRIFAREPESTSP